MKEKNLLKEKAHNICKLGIAQVPEGRRIFSQLAVKDNLKLGQFTIKDSAEKKEEDRANFYKVFLECLKEKISWQEHYLVENNRCLLWEEL